MFFHIVMCHQKGLQNVTTIQGKVLLVCLYILNIPCYIFHYDFQHQLCTVYSTFYSASIFLKNTHLHIYTYISNIRFSIITRLNLEVPIYKLVNLVQDFYHKMLLNKYIDIPYTK